MKSICLFALFIVLGMTRLHAQSNSVKIDIVKGFPKYAFKYGELTLSVREVGVIVKKNEQAYKLLKPAKVNYALGNGLATLGVAAIVVPLGQSILGSNFRYFWTFAGIGVGMCAISIPLLAKSDRQAIKAIETYNAGLSHHFNKYSPLELKAVATSNGIGLMLHF